MRAGQAEMGGLVWGQMGAELSWERPCPAEVAGHARYTSQLHALASTVFPPHAAEILILLGQLKPFSPVVSSQRCQHRTCVSLGSSHTFFVPCSLPHSAATIHFAVTAKYPQEHSSGSHQQGWGAGGLWRSWRSSSNHSCWPGETAVGLPTATVYFSIQA